MIERKGVQIQEQTKMINELQSEVDISYLELPFQVSSNGNTKFWDEIKILNAQQESLEFATGEVWSTNFLIYEKYYDLNLWYNEFNEVKKAELKKIGESYYKLNIFVKCFGITNSCRKGKLIHIHSLLKSSICICFDSYGRGLASILKNVF